MERVERAFEVLRDLVRERRVGADSGADALCALIAAFTRVEFDIPDVGDADGVLFEYGPVTGPQGSYFAIGFTRQLVCADEATYRQLAVGLRYRWDEDLRALGSGNDWWFRDGELGFADWLARVREYRVWGAVEQRVASGFDCGEDFNC